jgi:hypothetical protein
MATRVDLLVSADTVLTVDAAGTVVMERSLRSADEMTTLPATPPRTSSTRPDV